MDSFSMADVTRSVDQLRAQLSMTNLQVPRIDSFNDVYTFVSEYQLATATLPEEEKTKLLVKAFPIGRYQAWYSKELEPLIKRQEPWSKIKNLIIERYSESEDRDRYFAKLRELSFNDNGQNKLFDFVEDMTFAFSKAFPSGQDDDTVIRYVKSNIPQQFKPQLTLISDYNSPKTLKDFMRGIKQFDNSRSGSINMDKDHIKSSEIVNIFKELVKGIKEQGTETTRNAVAALQRSRDSSPFRHSNSNAGYLHQSARARSPMRQDLHINRPNSPGSYPYNSQQRGQSPRRQSVGQTYQSQPYYDNYYNQPNPQSYYQHDYRNQVPNPSANYHQSQYNVQGRPPSPGYRHPNNNYMQGFSMNQQYQAQQTQNMRPIQRQQSPQPPANIANDNQQGSSQAIPFDKSFSKGYYEKFGIPKRACTSCGGMHWDRHCLDHLN